MCVSNHVQFFCNPMDCSPPGFSVHGSFQTRILEWVAMSSSRGSSQPRDWTHVSCSSCTVGRFFTAEPLGKPSRRGKVPQNPVATNLGCQGKAMYEDQSQEWSYENLISIFIPVTLLWIHPWFSSILCLLTLSLPSSILTLGWVIIFMIMTLNSLLGRLLISTFV